MLKIEKKMSGWSVTDFEKVERLFDCQIITLDEVLEKVQKQETMNYILDKFRFTKGILKEEEVCWFCILDNDTIYKLSILDRYSDLENELVNYLGENWLDCYIRFGH